MKRRTTWTTLAALVCSAGIASASEDSISRKDLPRAVVRSVKAKFPGAKIKEAAREVEHGKTVFEVSLNIKGQTVDVSMTPDGTIVVIERTVSPEELPRAVKKALAARYPRAKIEKVETITRGEDGPVHYEVALSTEVVFNVNGKTVADADEEDDAREDKDDDDDDDDDDDEKGEVKSKHHHEAKTHAKKHKEEEDKDDDDDDEKGEVKSKRHHEARAHVKKQKDDDDDDEDED